MQLRIDVDYPFTSRWTSFFYTLVGGKRFFSYWYRYLENSKIIANMINESKENVKAYWFFTYKTLPDGQMLELISNSKHEIGLHAVNNIDKELKKLERVTTLKIRYYTVHGIKRFFAKIIWKHFRKLKIKDEKLQLFDFELASVDRLCYDYDEDKAYNITKESISKGNVVHFHPDWLFQWATLNKHAPYYNVLEKLLNLSEQK